jgi:hypothetical protein
MDKNEWRTNETDYVPTASANFRVKTKHTRLKHIKPMENLLCHSDHFLLIASSLIRIIKMGEMSKLHWLILKFH